MIIDLASLHIDILGLDLSSLLVEYGDHGYENIRP